MAKRRKRMGNVNPDVLQRAGSKARDFCSRMYRISKRSTMICMVGVGEAIQEVYREGKK